jgi:hypothetical protein
MNSSVATNANVTRIDRTILPLLSVGSCATPTPIRRRPTPGGMGRWPRLGELGWAYWDLGGRERGSGQPGEADGV